MVTFPKDLDPRWNLLGRSNAGQALCLNSPTSSSRGHLGTDQVRDWKRTKCAPESEVHLLYVQMYDDSCLAQTPDGLVPVDDLFESTSLADPIALGSARAPEELRRTAHIDARNVRSASMFTQMGNEILRVMAHACARRLRMNATASNLGEHRVCFTVLGMGETRRQDFHAPPVSKKCCSRVGRRIVDQCETSTR